MKETRPDDVMCLTHGWMEDERRKDRSVRLVIYYSRRQSICFGAMLPTYMESIMYQHSKYHSRVDLSVNTMVHFMQIHHSYSTTSYGKEREKEQL